MSTLWYGLCIWISIIVIGTLILRKLSRYWNKIVLYKGTVTTIEMSTPLCTVTITGGKGHIVVHFSPEECAKIKKGDIITVEKNGAWGHIPYEARIKKIHK